MRHLTIGTIAALGLAMVGATAAEAQRRTHAGARASYDIDVEEFAVGAHLSVPVARRLDFYPSFDNYFIRPGSLWSLNADLKFQPARRVNWFYLGGGLNVMNRSIGGFDDTNAGFNMLVGAETRRGWIHPFADARLTWSDSNRFMLAAGLNITLGRQAAASRQSEVPR